MSSTKSGIFVTGYHGSNILTAIYSVLSVPPLTTAAATAPSEPLQWLTLGIQWLPDGPWHLKQKNIEWWVVFWQFPAVFSPYGVDLCWKNAYTWACGNDISFCMGISMHKFTGEFYVENYWSLDLGWCEQRRGAWPLETKRNLQMKHKMPLYTGCSTWNMELHVGFRRYIKLSPLRGSSSLMGSWSRNSWPKPALLDPEDA